MHRVHTHTHRTVPRCCCHSWSFKWFFTVTICNKAIIDSRLCPQSCCHLANFIEMQEIPVVDCELCPYHVTFVLDLDLVQVWWRSGTLVSTNYLHCYMLRVTCCVVAWQTYRQTDDNNSLPLAGEVITVDKYIKSWRESQARRLRYRLDGTVASAVMTRNTFAWAKAVLLVTAAKCTSAAIKNINHSPVNQIGKWFQLLSQNSVHF